MKTYKATETLVWTQNTDPMSLTTLTEPHIGGKEIGQYFVNQYNYYEVWVDGKAPKTFVMEDNAKNYLLGIASNG